MSKCKGLLYKTIILGTIFLFIGLGIQPVLANQDNDLIKRGFIVCYTRIGFPKSNFYLPATLSIVICEDLDTGNIRIGITRFSGFHIFKFLPMGHDYKISAYPFDLWDNDIIVNNLCKLDIAIISYSIDWK